MSRKCILVVEDEFLIGLDIAETLEARGHDVVWAVSSVEAKSLIGERRIDRAVLDFHLQDGDTTELATHLSERGVPFIVCSGSSSLAEIGEAFAEARFLPKPYTTEALVDAVTAPLSH